MKRICDNSSQSEVGYLQYLVLTDQYVLWLQIPMENSFAVHVERTLQQLLHVTLL